MVAVCVAGYAGNSIPEVVRLRNASGSSFDVRMQNPSGTALAGETVHCLVVEEGAWQLPDGRLLEAQKYTSTVTDGRTAGWSGEAQSYSNSYTQPVVLGQVMSFNDSNWSVFWSNGGSRSSPPTASTLFAGKNVAEDTITVRADEEIGFVVIEAGNGSINGAAYEADLGADTVRGLVQTSVSYTFNQSFGSTPQVAIASQAAMDGNNGGWTLLRGASPLSPTTMTLGIDEDQIRDSERNHTTEQVAYFVVESNVSVVLSQP